MRNGSENVRTHSRAVGYPCIRPALVIVLLCLLALCYGCYFNRWYYSPDPVTTSLAGWEVRFWFGQLEWTAPPEFDKGDTAFILLVHYRCPSSRCNTRIAVSEPVMIAYGGSEPVPLSFLHAYSSKEDSVYSTLEFGPIRPEVNQIDTVSIQIELVAHDVTSGKVLETMVVQVIGLPQRERTGVLRSMLRGI